MNQSTRDLIAYLNSTGKADFSIVDTYVYATLHCGTGLDAAALLACFLENPDDQYRTGLLEVVCKFGHTAHAEQLAKTCFVHGKLRENISPDVLEVIGRLNYEPFKSVLADYAFGKIQSGYYEEKAATLGLLHFDCAEYREIILQEIEKCYGQGLFPEFIPALVCKLEEPQQIETLAKLYELGSEYASTDCNAGIILGFSLCGEAGRGYFDRILFDPRWECCDSATGSLHVTYLGMKHLGMDFKELYQQVLTVEYEPDLVYRMTIFITLLQKRITDPEITDLNHLMELFDLLFAWENPNKQNHFWDLLDRAEMQEVGCQTEKMLIQKLKEWVILSNFQGVKTE